MSSDPVKYISFVSGAAVAILQYFQPIGDTWIGHEKWASDNLVLSAYLGAGIGAVLFFARSRLPKQLKYSILILAGVGFVGGLALSIYWSLNITAVTTHADQLFYRDTVWKLAHLCGTGCLTILLFCLSFLEDS